MIKYIYGNQFAVNNKLEVYIEPVQQQEGEMDCGVFSIVQCCTCEEYERCTKDVTYDSQQMR